MKYVIRAAPILVALALFVSFLVVQQGNTARAAIVGLTLSVTPGIDAGTVTDPSHVSSNVNVATSGRSVVVSVIEDTSTTSPTVTVKNDTSGDSITLVVAGGSPPSTAWTGTFVVKDPATSPNSPTEIQAEDGDVIQVTVGFLIASFTVDSDPPDMNQDDMVPGDGDISGDGLTSVSGKVNDDGAGVAEEDISVWTAPAATTLSRVPASLVSFTETAAEDGFTFSTFINIPTDGTQDLQFQAIDSAGNALFSDSDDTTDCVVGNAGGVLTDIGALCDLNTFEVDTVAPILADAFTGLAFDEDSSDCDTTTCALDENERDWIMALFTDVGSVLDGSSVDLEDFLVDGSTPKAVKWFDEDGMVDNADGDGPWVIRKLVFIQVGAAQTADATPKINLGASAGGVQDEAVNIRTTGEVAEAKDLIGPLFVLSNFIPAPSSSSLVGDEVEVTFTISADEEADSKPTVTVSNVFNPSSSLDATVSTAGTNRWSVVVDEVGADTATIYNIHITGKDTSGNSADLGIKNVDDADPTDLNENATTTDSDLIIDGFFDTITDTVKSPDAGFALFSNFSAADINEDAIYFEGDTKDLAAPESVPAEDDSSDIRSPFFISLDFGAEGSEFEEDDHADVDLLMAMLDGEDVLASASTADQSKWLIAIIGIALGEHELVINASDQAGNDLADGEFTLTFEVTERAAIEVSLNPGWNLVSLPGQPADPSIDAVMAGNDATAVITFDPTIPGGFLVAVRDVGEPFSGTLKTMSATRGYWVLTDSFQPISVDVPPLAAGSAGVLPPTIPIAKGWNLVPIQDPTGQFAAGTDLEATDYFTSAVDVSAVYFFDTIANAWVFVDITSSTASVTIGRAYWVFSTEAGSLVPVPIEQDD